MYLQEISLRQTARKDFREEVWNFLKMYVKKWIFRYMPSAGSQQKKCPRSLGPGQQVVV